MDHISTPQNTLARDLYVMDLDSFAGTNPACFEFKSRINLIYFTVDQTLVISDKKDACYILVRSSRENLGSVHWVVVGNFNNISISVLAIFIPTSWVGSVHRVEVCFMVQFLNILGSCFSLVAHMAPEGRLYSSKSTNGGKGLKNSKINNYFTPW